MEDYSKMHKELRQKIVDGMKAKVTDTPAAPHVILLQGGETPTRYDTDFEPLFRQESFFQYAFGVKEPDCVGLLRVGDAHATLFIPRLPADYATWMGRIRTPAEFKAEYGVDEVRYVDELGAALSDVGARVVVHTLSGVNSDSRRAAKPVALPSDARAELREDRVVLRGVMVAARVIKTDAELALLRRVNALSSDAHRRVMARAVRPGAFEYQLEATFLHAAYHDGGARHAAYTSICGCGPNAAVLHYGHAAAPNARQLRSGDLVLCDMGAELHCYTSDITRTMPVNGRFTADQRAVYAAVRAASQAVMKTARDGVAWPAMHMAAARVILEHLRALGVLCGDVDAMLAAALDGVFMPHGLGHLMGLDTHDVGGYVDDDGNELARSERPGLSALRCARTLRACMVITIEPGCYFIDHLLDRALADATLAAFIDAAALERFRGFGGVRIEDDVVITATGVENLTTVTSDPDEVERIMADGAAEEQATHVAKKLKS